MSDKSIIKINRDKKTIDIWDLGIRRDKGSRTSLYNICNQQASLHEEEYGGLPEWECFCGKGMHNFVYAKTPLLYKNYDRKITAFYGMKYDTNRYGLMPLGWTPPDKIDYVTVLGEVVEPLGYEIIG